MIKKRRRLFKKLQVFAKNFGQDLKKATADGALSPESAAILEKSYGRFIKNTEKLMTTMLGSVDSEFSEGVEYINEQVRNARVAIQKLQVDKKNLLIKRDTEGKVIPQSQKADKTLDRGIVQQLEKEGIIKEKLLSYNNREIKDVNVLRETRMKLLADAEKLGDEEREKLETLGSSKEEQIEALDILKKVSETNESNLTAEQALQQLNNLKAIEGRKQAILQGEEVKLLKLETEEKRIQNKLDTDEIQQEMHLVDLKKQGAGTGDQKTENKVKSDTAKIMEVVVKTTKEYNKVKADSIKKEKQDTKEKRKNVVVTKKQEGALAKATKQVFSYGLAFTVLRRVYRETIRTITELDHALTEMAIVTTMNREETWKLVGTFQSLARQTGFTTTEIAKLSTVYFRQGRVLADVIELTTVAAKAARVAGISAQESADYLTSAINGFGLAAEQALAVSDKFAALAATSASSYEELAKGLSKFAAQANVAGISISFAMGMLAKGVETTREAPETIGTALKTVLARLRELTDYGKTLEDGMDINRVETALAQMDVKLRDVNGQFRDMQSVLTDLGVIWDTLNTNQQASIAVALAGTRQQSRLIAVMQDFERTQELITTAEEAAGATTAQHVEYMQSMEAAMVGLQNAWQAFITAISDSDIIISMVKSLTKIIDIATSSFKFLGNAGQALLYIMVGLLLVMKSWGAIVKIGIALQNLHAAATWKIVTAKTGELVIVTGTTTAMLAYFAVISLGLILIVALIAGTIKLSQSTEKATEEFKKMTQEIKAANYEFNTTINKTEELIKKIEALNKLSFLTPEQVGELEMLGNKLVDVIPTGYLDFNNDGTVNYEASKSGISAFLESQRQDIRDSNDELFKETIKYANTMSDWREIVDNSILGLNINEEGDFEKSTQLDEDKLLEDPLAIKNLTDYLVFQYEDMYGALTDEENTLYREHLKNRLIADPNFINWTEEGVSSYIKGDMKELLKTIEEYLVKIEDEEVDFSERMENFREAYNKATKEDNQEAISILEDRYRGLKYIMDSGFGADFAQGLENIGMTNLTDLQNGIELYGEGIEDLIKNVESRAKILIAGGMSETQAYSRAWSDLSLLTEDATKKLWLYNQAFQTTNLVLSQNLDKLASKMEQVQKVQKEWAEGTLSKFDLYDFFENHEELFQTIEQVEKFLSGENINSAYFAEAIKEEQKAIAGLNAAQVKLNIAEKDSIEYKEALGNYAYFSALLQYNGALTAVTEEQLRYNAALKDYNRLIEWGSNSLQKQEALIDRQATLLYQQINVISESAEQAKAEFQTILDTLGLDGTWNDYIENVDGTLVPIYSKLEGLTDTTITEMMRVVDEFQNELDSLYDNFNNLREADLKAEKDKLDKQKQIYEDYFKKIDDLEKQRDQKKTKEEIIAQLQRLEGATDERSRQKALELRKELNALDETMASDRQKVGRDALLQSFDDKYIELEEKWTQLGLEFISAMSTGGAAAGQAFISALIDAGYGNEGYKTTILDTIVDSGNLSDPSLIDYIEQNLGDEMALIRANASGTGMSMSDLIALAKTNLTKKYNQSSASSRKTGAVEYAKGGLVDFTGLAQLHGSSSKPEMVLDAAQTQMFIGLRNALSKLSIDGGSSESIKIEKIEIKTDKLNTNQDFDAAGKVLASAFNKAIKNRGISTNIKR